MDELPDFELRRTSIDEPPPLEPRPARPIVVWIVAAVLLVAACAAAYFAFAWRQAPVPATPAASTAIDHSKEPPSPLGGAGASITVPPLDASDTLVRTLVQALSESPAIMAWLPTTGLIRNFTVVVANIADGATPAKQLKVLRPASPFRVVERGGSAYIDPRSYDRYTVIADAIASVDPAGAARLYATLKPRIEEAHSDLGSPESFDRTLERAIVALLDTPAADGAARLKPKGIGYGYADEPLEGLTAAQRQFLRMGPRNVRVVKARLREIALALGIPATRLPAR